MGQKDFREMIITNSCCRGKRHSLSTNIQWIRLSRIGEWNWAFSRRVDDSEEINTESNTSDLYLRRAGNPKTESSEEQAKRHKRESGQKQTIRKWRVSNYFFLGGDGGVVGVVAPAICLENKCLNRKCFERGWWCLKRNSS
jgi:hypothetical protein